MGALCVRGGGAIPAGGLDCNHQTVLVSTKSVIRSGRHWSVIVGVPPLGGALGWFLLPTKQNASATLAISS